MGSWNVRRLAGVLTLGATALALGSVVARAQAPEAPKPAAEMAALGFFDGHWTCEGNVPAGPFGPGGEMTSKVDIETTFGGFWQSGHVQAAIPGMPPFEGRFYTTYDAASARYVMVWVDNSGAWSTTDSKGWSGDEMAFEGEGVMGGQKAVTRDTFWKQADGSMKHRGEIELAGNWTTLMEEVCKKAGR